jgi:hypothetical protein
MIFFSVLFARDFWAIAKDELMPGECKEMHRFPPFGHQFHGRVDAEDLIDARGELESAVALRTHSLEEGSSGA